MAGIGLLGVLAMLVGLGCLICWIMVLIKQFKDAGPIHGIIGIITCTIWTLIWGWMNATRLNIKNLMLIWTILLVIYIILYVVVGGAMFASMGGLTPAPTP
jgi:hypothetical protein